MGKVVGHVRRRADMALARARCAAAYFLKDEQGDTNFISILILLGIALGLAATFLVFRDQIVTWINGMINKFTNQVNVSNSHNTNNISTAT